MKFIKHIIPAIFLFLFIASCEKYEQEPVHYLTYDYVFDGMDQNGDYARLALNHLYTLLPNGFNRISNVVLDAASDDAIASANFHSIEMLSKSRLTPLSSNPDGKWFSNYKGIRKINVFLNNIDQVPVDDLNKQYWKAEARFIRAMVYFELIKRYGGVSLIGDNLYERYNEINMERNSYDECVSYIVNELDAIQSDLRPDPVPDTDLGRITVGAALALKSRVLLYAASPLNNPNNDVSKWQAASDAAKAVIDLNKFSLLNNFTNIFVMRENSEIILAYQRDLTIEVERDNAPIGYAEPNHSNGYVSPTQELVEAFPMKNGLAIEDSNSGYDPQQPYSNRDPRLNSTVFYNGSMWLSRPVETFDGGMDKPNDVHRQTQTGYYMRKFLADMSNSTDLSKQSHNFVIMRYAEILLNYAEAANETGSTEIAYEQLRTIRERAGINAGAENLYGLKANMTQEEMREAIRLERRLELAFEEHRFWDVRRWKIAEQVVAEPLHGVKIIKNDDDTFTYNTIEVFQMQFSAPKDYLYPIPFEEISANPEIIQNPGY